MSIRRWGDEDERPVAEMGPSTTAELLFLIGLILLVGWIMTRPVTAVQNVDNWPAAVSAEVGR